MKETREHIKARMLRNAAKVWRQAEKGVDVDFDAPMLENNFDPLVSMLLTACAAEISKISDEIESSRTRVLERLVQLLSPDAHTGAAAAHAIACATPVDKSLDITEYEQYYISTKIPGSQNSAETHVKDIFFSPSGTFRLNRAAIKYIASGNMLFKINGTDKERPDNDGPGKENSGINKILVGRSEKHLPDCSLWIAIDQPDVSLKNTLFYFECRNPVFSELFYHQLPKAKWYRNDQLLDTVPGYGERYSSDEIPDFGQLLKREDNSGEQIKQHVNAFYKKGFVCLKDTKDLCTTDNKGLLANVIGETFIEKDLVSELQAQQLRWICIDFPQTVNSTILQNVMCTMNSFPVINRRLHNLTYRLQSAINVIPLLSDETFLYLDEAVNDEGKVLNIQSVEERESYGVLLRNGGVGRFDERDARGILNYLVQLLRDESVAFNNFGSDFLNREVKQLQQIVNRLEQKLFDNGEYKSEIPYLMVKNNGKKAWQNLYLRYWTTTGLYGNNIKSGKNLLLYKGSHIQSNTVALVTTTQGGRDKLNTTESILAYKSAVLSKSRLITAEDIKAYCRYIIGESVKKVEVRKGVMVPPEENQGFVKTLDVIISLSKKDYDRMKAAGELDYWNRNLQVLLEDKSVPLYPFRIFINQELKN
ncbi:MAG: type VI secretion system baseplate subunit TssF [Chitinophagaceae bacterium]|nr:type VI secretion system baseplate subunit TssF [Chitinophagaceae bacterium]